MGMLLIVTNFFFDKIKTIAKYSCDDSTIELRKTPLPNWIEGVGAKYLLVHVKNGKELLLAYDIMNMNKGFKPLPVNTEVQVKVFEAPNFSADGPIETAYLDALINIFISVTVPKEEFETISVCLGKNREQINKDLGPSNLFKWIIEKETGVEVEYVGSRRLGGIAHTEPVRDKVRNLASEFKTKSSEYVDIEIDEYGSIFQPSSGYIGDLFTGSPVIDSNLEKYSEMRNQNGEDIITYIKRAQKSLGVKSVQ